MSDYVRFPEAYRRQYWALLDALEAIPVGDPVISEKDAKRLTGAALDVFDNDQTDRGPDLGPELCSVCGREIGSLPVKEHEKCRKLKGLTT